MRTKKAPWDYDRQPKGGPPIAYVICPTCGGEAMPDRLRNDGTIICGVCRGYWEEYLDMEADRRAEADYVRGAGHPIENGTKREEEEQLNKANSALYDDVADAKICAGFGCGL